MVLSLIVPVRFFQPDHDKGDFMTVSDLKKLCEQLPETMPVCLHAWAYRGTTPLEPLPYVDSVAAVVEHNRVVICSFRDPEVKFK